MHLEMAIRWANDVLRMCTSFSVIAIHTKPLPIHIHTLMQLSPFILSRSISLCALSLVHIRHWLIIQWKNSIYWCVWENFSIIFSSLKDRKTENSASCEMKNEHSKILELNRWMKWKKGGGGDDDGDGGYRSQKRERKMCEDSLTWNLCNLLFSFLIIRF